jgi:predicted Zn finger-like uncharacterized protein
MAKVLRGGEKNPLQRVSMRVACSQCSAQYVIPEEKLLQGAVKVRCTRCRHLFLVRKRSPRKEAPAAAAAFDDFDFGAFEAGGPAPQPAEEPAAARTPPSSFRPEQAEESDMLAFEDLEIPGLGELDLGDFEGETGGMELDDGSEAEPFSLGDAEPLERVRREELVTPPAAGANIGFAPYAAEDTPRLDLQKGPRRLEPGMAGPPVVAGERRRSPLLWFVVVAALGTLAYTGYNIYRHPEAFTFLHPGKLKELWRTRQVETKLSFDGVQGYYRDLSGGRRVFVIRGQVANRSERSQGLIKVRGALFGEKGVELAVREAYCGNVLSERELESLPRETIEARLQNQVGEALSNVDIAPGSAVPFMLVFLPPPEAVAKYDVSITAFKAGASS